MLGRFFVLLLAFGALVALSPSTFASDVKRYHCPGGSGGIAYDVEIDVSQQRIRTTDFDGKFERWMTGEIKNGVFKSVFMGEENAEYFELEKGKHTVFVFGTPSKRYCKLVK